MVVGLGYGLVGIGVGLAGTPASRSLTGSVPVTRAGMASGTADLQRDLGGAIMQSIFGALLTAGYAAAAAGLLAGAPPNPDVTTAVQNQLTMSYAGAADIAAQYPQYSTQIIQGAKEAFLAGDQWAYLAGIIAVLLGGVLVFLKFPRKDEEHQLLAQYREQDAASRPRPAGIEAAPSWIPDGVIPEDRQASCSGPAPGTRRRLPPRRAHRRAGRRTASGNS